MRARSALVSVLLMVCASGLDAQQMQGVSVGDTVRFWAPGIRINARTATVLPWEGTTAWFAAMGRQPDTLDVPFIRLTRLEVYEGKNHLQGALRGGAIGGGVGMLLGLIIGELAVSGCTEFLCELDAIGYMGGGLLIGTVTGITIGAASPPDRWRRVDLPVEAGFPPSTRPWHKSTGWVVFSTVLGLLVTVAIN